MTTSEHTTYKKIRLFDSPTLQEKLKQLGARAFQEFFAFTQVARTFHLAFLGLCLAELCAILFLSYLSKSLYIAICLAGFCLTLFSYFLLSFYLDAKKPEQIDEIQKNYLSACQELLGREQADPLAQAQMLQHLSSMLDLKHWTSLVAPFAFLQPFYEKWQVWLHWKVVHQMQEQLLLTAVNFHIEKIKQEPVDLEAHATLSNTYLALAKLYRAPSEWPWVPSIFFSKEMNEKFRACATRAIQEFKILSTLAPNDPWVHAQLASVYRDLEMRPNEIQEYELLLKLSPQNREVMFRLGMLYFEQGETARALFLYQELKKAHDPRAADLISLYE